MGWIGFEDKEETPKGVTGLSACWEIWVQEWGATWELFKCVPQKFTSLQPYRRAGNN